MLELTSAVLSYQALLTVRPGCPGVHRTEVRFSWASASTAKLQDATHAVESRTPMGDPIVACWWRRWKREEASSRLDRHSARCARAELVDQRGGTELGGRHFGDHEEH